MKKITLFTAFIAIMFLENTSAQEVQNSEKPSVAVSIKGIQIGETGVVFNYERMLTRQITLRTEAGLTVAIASGDENWFTGEKEKGSVIALPSFTIEPRWYYNLGRRVRKGKDISRNRANYFAVSVNYAAGWAAIKFDDRQDETPDFITIAPMWGLRRTLGEYFNYEVGAGIGYYSITNYKHFDHSHSGDEGIVLILRARFGFDF